MIFYGAREFRTEVTGGTMTGLTFGTGPKNLVMVPGLRLSDMEGSAITAALYYRMFAKDYTVYMFDRKVPAAQRCTNHDLAEDLVQAMKANGIDHACILGVSQGGMIAQDLTIHHPELTEKLVLGVTAARPNSTMEEVIQRWITLAQTSGMKAIAEDYMLTACSDEYIRKYRRLILLALKVQKTMPADRFLILAKAVLSCHTYEDLDRISCPVLVLGGMQDRIVTPQASLEIAEKLHCEYYMYETCGHEAYQEAGDFNQRVYEFFARK